MSRRCVICGHRPASSREPRARGGALRCGDDDARPAHPLLRRLVRRRRRRPDRPGLGRPRRGRVVRRRAPDHGLQPRRATAIRRRTSRRAGEAEAARADADARTPATASSLGFGTNDMTRGGQPRCVSRRALPSTTLGRLIDERRTRSSSTSSSSGRRRSASRRRTSASRELSAASSRIVAQRARRRRTSRRADGALPRRRMDASRRPRTTARTRAPAAMRRSRELVLDGGWIDRAGSD